MIAGVSVVLGHACGAVLLAWAYFRWVRMARPPVGVLNRSDVLIMMAVVVLVPYLYLVLPLWLVGALLGAVTIGVLYVTAEPIPVARRASWLGVLALVVADLASWLHLGASAPTFVLVNNVVLTVAAVGVANLWAQSGMKARDLALLGGLLAIYDTVFTAQLPVTDDLLARLAGLPFAPQVAWPIGDDQWVGLGLGDLLMAAAFPLVMRKAFSRAAGLAALATSLAVVAALFGLALLGVLAGGFPLMVVLGPLMVVQYRYWIGTRRRERTTWEYLRGTPRRGLESACMPRPRRTGPAGEL